jgi:general secretion pathway protein C
VYADGKLQGYRLYPQGPSSEFEKRGLQPGDLLTAVNGQALADPVRSEQIFVTAVQSGHAVLQLQRDGQTLQVILEQTRQ